MKVRNGFVSNSSSSSFLIITASEIETKEELRLLFKKTKEIKRKELVLYPENKKVNEMLDETVDALLNTLSYEEYEADKLYKEGEEVPALSFYVVKDWDKLLKDKNSWLYRDIYQAVSYVIYRTLHYVPSDSLGGQLGEDIKFNLPTDMPYYNRSDSSYDDFVDESVEKYIGRLYESLTESGKIKMYRIDTSTEFGEDAKYNVESWFLRYNFGRIVANYIEYIRFEYS